MPTWTLASAFFRITATFPDRTDLGKSLAFVVRTMVRALELPSDELDPLRQEFLAKLLKRSILFLAALVMLDMRLARDDAEEQDKSRVESWN